jgi:hypothetical protein
MGEILESKTDHLNVNISLYSTFTLGGKAILASEEEATSRQGSQMATQWANEETKYYNG